MWLEYLNIARKVLVGHKFRSLLTVLSITIGAFSIVVMSSLAQSGLTTLFRGMEELGGGRLIFVGPKQAEREEAKQASYTRGLTVEDRDIVFERLPHVVEHSMFTSLGRKEMVSDTGRLKRTDLVAADGDFFSFTHLVRDKGRFFDSDDDAKHAKVCVVGAKVAQEMWDGEAVGHTLELDGIRCRVIGQTTDLDRWGMDFDFSWVDFVAMPLETVNEVDQKAKAAAQLQVKTDDASHNDIVKRIANALLADRHHGIDDYEIFDMSSIMNNFNSFFAIMRTIVGFIAGIALLVGGVGVMNMMLVSVSERVREIGIRKAIGANPNDIGRQFLLEAIVLAGTGGVIGVVSGVGVTYFACWLIRHFKPTWVTVLAHGAIIAALSVSVGVGLLFGYFPARRASKLDAITAIRGS
ncbi:MAG TPA: ABC transporter permease [Polyangia bacterium]|nr:ABC transporter permease [Polyangia bacterium]